MIFKYNSVSHVYKDYEKKKGSLIINPKLSQPEFEAALIALKKVRDQQVKIEKYKGIPYWKVVVNHLVPMAAVVLFVWWIYMRSVTH